MAIQQSVWPEGTNRTVLAGTARVELCEQGSSDLAHLDDGPYEAGGEKEQDPSLIPVPANSYFGRDPSLAQNCSNPVFPSLFPSLSMLPSFCLCHLPLASWFLSFSSSPPPFTLFWPVWLALSVCASFSCRPCPGVSPRPAPHRVAFCDQH